MRNFLIAFLLLLYLIFGWLSCRDHKKCCSGEQDVSAVPVISNKTGPLLFAHNDSLPITGEGWAKLRDSLLTLASDSTSLEISGWYCTNLNPVETESLAMARAREVRKLFAEIPDERIILLSQGVTCDSLRINRNDVAASFASRVRTANIKEIADRTLIYFPFNSTSKLNNLEVENYLNDVVARVIKSGESITLTGHTDNIGSDKSNLALGQQRADIIKRFLVEKGVSPDKIQATTKGESTPIAENTSENGRAKNRRTELQIIK